MTRKKPAKKPVKTNNFERQISVALADIHDSDKMLEFLRSFLSTNELLQLGTRLAIHTQLQAGKSYEYIQKKLGVSSATISIASQQHKNPAIQMALKIIALDTWARTVAKKIYRYVPFL